MIAVLIAVRDFFVAVLISWLGLTIEPTDQTKKAEQPPAAPAKIAMIG